MRVTGHPILADLPVREVAFVFNGHEYRGHEGEPLAAALLAQGVRILRHSPRTHEARGIYCGIGHCYECRVWLNGDVQVRSCLTPVTEGAVFSSERGER